MFVCPIDTHIHILKPMYNWACPRTYIHICNSMYVCMKCKYIFVWSFIYTWNICYKPFLLSSQHLPLSMDIHTNIYPVVSQHYVFTQLSKVDVVWYGMYVSICDGRMSTENRTIWKLINSKRIKNQTTKKSGKSQSDVEKSRVSGLLIGLAWPVLGGQNESNCN